MRIDSVILAAPRLNFRVFSLGFEQLRRRETGRKDVLAAMQAGRLNAKRERTTRSGEAEASKRQRSCCFANGPSQMISTRRDEIVIVRRTLTFLTSTPADALGNNCSGQASIVGRNKSRGNRSEVQRELG